MKNTYDAFGQVYSDGEHRAAPHPVSRRAVTLTVVAFWLFVAALAAARILILS